MVGGWHTAGSRGEDLAARWRALVEFRVGCDGGRGTAHFREEWRLPWGRQSNKWGGVLAPIACFTLSRRHTNIQSVKRLFFYCGGLLCVADKSDKGEDAAVSQMGLEIYLWTMGPPSAALLTSPR